MLSDMVQVVSVARQSLSTLQGCSAEGREQHVQSLTGLQSTLVNVIDVCLGVFARLLVMAGLYNIQPCAEGGQSS